MIWTIAKKELRGYFNSAIALLFLGAFLVATLVAFFWIDKFFARGLADLRPLFDRMPILLIILVSALSMRQWAEERSAGTLELLLTLPVERWKLVAGKFLAGLVLVAIALGLTLGIPVTVAFMGDLDPGPVIGGYFASLLLAAAYLVIGMCISAVTNLQIVAFVLTAVVCTITYLIGDAGTGAHFQSVARGVLDLRDLAYYGGIVGAGIVLNVALLGELTAGHAGTSRRGARWLALGLVAANAIALLVWLAPVRRVRIDLTHDGAYSLSDSTRAVLARVDEPLAIRAYLSAHTHPDLEPLIPQLRDLLDEYRLAGGGHVTVEVLDPDDRDDVKRDAKESYDIEATPLQFETTTEKTVINAYFTVAIDYGGRHEILRVLPDLVQIRVHDRGVREISLKNPEYTVTKAIKKLISSFSSVDAQLAAAPQPVRITGYLTPASFPPALKDAPAAIKTAIAELTKTAGGKIEYVEVAPDAAKRRELATTYGLRPYRDLLSGSEYYFSFILQYGDRVIRAEPPESDITATALEDTLRDGVKRVVPGFTRVVGLWSPPAVGGEPAYPGMPPQGGQAPQTFALLQRALAENYEVRDVPLTGRVPDDVEVLVLGGPARLDATAVEAVDQFVMRGGSLVVLGGRFRIAPGDGLALEPVTTGLEPMFTKWGITVFDQLVRDPSAESFPAPQERDVGSGRTVREIVQKPYPLFVRLVGDQLAASSLITSGLPGAVMHFASPVDAAVKVGDDTRVVEPLLASSSEAILTTSTDATPDYAKYPDGFPPPDETADRKSRTLGVSVIGGFPSSLAATPAADKNPKPSAARRIEHSPPDTRVVVFGSSAFVSDDVLRLAEQLGSDLASANLQLVHNAVDWALADTDLLAIRNRAAARALTIAPEERETWRVVNLAIALAGLALVIGIALIRRMRVAPVIQGTTP